MIPALTPFHRMYVPPRPGNQPRRRRFWGRVVVLVLRRLHRLWYDPSMSPDLYPNIKRAALSMAYDNERVDFTHPEKLLLFRLSKWLSHQPKESLSNLDAWLGSLSERQMKALCSDDTGEVDEILIDAPPGTDSLLDDCFEAVC